jgi:hypothetical protein
MYRSQIIIRHPNQNLAIHNRAPILSRYLSSLETQHQEQNSIGIIQLSLNKALEDVPSPSLVVAF